MAENKIVTYCGKYSKRRFVMFRKVGAKGERKLKNEKGKRKGRDSKRRKQTMLIL